MEFTLLSIIASHGEAGMLQPALITISGQDKRSVPKRTDNLAEHGYITKVAVAARGQRTSLLKLKRFDPKSIEDKVEAMESPFALRDLCFQNGAFMYEPFAQGLYELLKDVRVMLFYEVRRAFVSFSRLQYPL